MSNREKIQLSLDIYNGSDTIEKHLVRASTETNDEFLTRKKSFASAPLFKNGIDALVNLVLSEPFDYVGLDSRILDYYENDIDGKNTSFHSFIRESLRLLVLTNKSFIEVWSDTENPDRPFLRSIPRLSVEKIVRLGDYPYIRVKSSYVENVDKYDVEIKDESLLYFEDGTVEVFREDQLYETIYTDYNRIPISETTLIGSKTDFDNDLPPYMDLAKLQLRWSELDSRKNSFVNKLAIPVVVTWGLDIEGLIDDQTVDTTVTNEVTSIELGGSRGINFPVNKDGRTLGDLQFRELKGENDAVMKLSLKDIEDEIKNGFVRFSNSDKGNKSSAESENERLGAVATIRTLITVVNDMIKEAHVLVSDAMNIEPKGEIVVNNAVIDSLGNINNIGNIKQ